MKNDNLVRCAWCGNDPLYMEYHDTEWGVPVYDDRKMFEFVVLEGAQAGLSWITILRRRENYRKAFADFDPKKVAKFTPEKVEELLLDVGIIRNRLKVKATVTNAIAFLEVAKEFGSFSNYLWGYFDNKVQVNNPKTMGDLPATTQMAEKISKDLKKRGFKFFGPTICYAHLQAVGIVNDHTVDCYRKNEV